LHIPSENVFANTLLFDDDGEFKGFDESEPTSRSGGKAKVVEQIKKVCHSNLSADGSRHLCKFFPKEIQVSLISTCSANCLWEGLYAYVVFGLLNLPHCN
jgi:hypothetical protein